ncbi:hypothetical protein KCP76_08175 [Salmonella enterica subsp. enterica serovar Weltevreden]|nr:hypothetical protein KCP76_08175 [Salmonella enterica subsp. enterica serovar Weltevreden]
MVLVLRNDRCWRPPSVIRCVTMRATPSANSHQLGVNGVILTGDNPRAAAAIAGELDLAF